MKVLKGIIIAYGVGIASLTKFSWNEFKERRKDLYDELDTPHKIYYLVTLYLIAFVNTPFMVRKCLNERGIK